MSANYRSTLMSERYGAHYLDNVLVHHGQTVSGRSGNTCSTDVHVFNNHLYIELCQFATRVIKTYTHVLIVFSFTNALK